jgi:ubiquinol-cytochrome c reductase cytochrome b subunit
LAAVHLIALHEHGSGNPLGVTSNTDRLPMHPYFTLKDGVTVIALLLITAIFIAFIPNYLGHPDNYIKANPMSTPLSIVPE